jgi:hypothetical protein
LMVPLSAAGEAGKQIQVVDFPGGQNPFGKVENASFADSMAQVPGENAMLVANPADQAVYFYKEGMAAPMGTFSNYARNPRAVLVVDRSLQQVSPGVYQTAAKARKAGDYSVAVFVNSPRVAQCFNVSIRPSLAGPVEPKGVVVKALWEARTFRPGESVKLQFQLTRKETGQPVQGLKDLIVLTYFPAGTWNKRQQAQSAAPGIYEIEFTPPERGSYRMALDSPSIGLALNDPQGAYVEVGDGR